MSEIDDRLRAMTFNELRELYIAAERWEEDARCDADSPLRKLAWLSFDPPLATDILNVVARMVFRELARRSFEPVFKAYDSGVQDGEKTGLTIGRRAGYRLAVERFSDDQEQCVDRLEAYDQELKAS